MVIRSRELVQCHWRSCLISLVGQWGEELPRVLWAAGRSERLGQTGALPARSRDLLLPEPSTSLINELRLLSSLFFFFFFFCFFYNISSPFCICYTCRTFSFFSLGWSLWTEGQARQARLPAFGSVLWDHRPACWSDLHRLGHPLLYPAARQHVLQLIWGACA